MMANPFRKAVMEVARLVLRLEKKVKRIYRPMTGARNIPLLRIATERVSKAVEAGRERD